LRESALFVRELGPAQGRGTTSVPRLEGVFSDFDDGEPG